jgi:hypothetical protein
VVLNFVANDFPSTLADRKAFLARKFCPFIEATLGEVVFDVYPKAVNFDSSTFPSFEIRFHSATNCREFKHEHHKRAKDNPEKYGNVEFHPKLTQASRV